MSNPKEQAQIQFVTPEELLGKAVTALAFLRAGMTDRAIGELESIVGNLLTEGITESEPPETKSTDPINPRDAEFNLSKEEFDAAFKQ